MGLIDRGGEKGTCQSIAAYQASGDVLIYSSNETVSETACAVGHHLVRPIIIHCYSQRSIICISQIGDLNGNVVGITTLVSFKSLMVAQISAIPPGMWIDRFSKTVYR